MNQPAQTRGFTLIELMIVVAIIGIIAGIAYPSYMETVMRSNRADAKTELNDVAQRLQRCYTLYSAYNNGSCAVYTQLSTGDEKIESREGLYDITISGDTATTYTLTATPVAGKVQAKDSKCKTFTLNHTGARGATGGDAGNCW